MKSLLHFKRDALHRNVHFVFEVSQLYVGLDRNHSAGHSFQRRLSFVLRSSLWWCQTRSLALVFTEELLSLWDPNTSMHKLSPSVKREVSEGVSCPLALWATGGSVPSSRVARPCPRSSVPISCWGICTITPLTCSPLPCRPQKKYILTVTHKWIFFWKFNRRLVSNVIWCSWWHHQAG